MRAKAGKKQRKRYPVIHLQALTPKRIVIELTTSGSERFVAVDVGNPPAAPSETVSIDALAAEFEVIEIGPNQVLNVVSIRIVTAVPGDAVERSPYNWRDLDDELRDDRVRPEN